MKTISVFVTILLISVLFAVSGCVDTNNITIENTPEGIVSAYIDAIGRADYETKVSVTTGNYKEFNQAQHDWINNMSDITQPYIEKCEEYNLLNLKDKINCKLGDIKYFSTGNISDKTILVKDIKDSTAIVLVNYTFINYNRTHYDYYLEYNLIKDNDDWKIKDITNLEDNSILTPSNEDILKAKQRDFSELKQNIEIDIAAIEEVIQIEQIKSDIHYAAKYSVDKFKAIETTIAEKDGNIYIDSKSFQLKEKDIVVNAKFYFNDGWMVDEYLGMEKDMTNMYKAVFKKNSNIKLVALTCIKIDQDSYGNPYQETLGTSYMIRETFNKINWEAFEYNKLDEITLVSFSGESFYTSLRDLQSDLESAQYGGGIYPSEYSYVGGSPSDLCSEAQEQCNIYGSDNPSECDVINILKSQGMC